MQTRAPAQDKPHAGANKTAARSHANFAADARGRESASACATMPTAVGESRRACPCGGGCPACASSANSDVRRKASREGGGGKGEGPMRLVREVLRSAGRPLDASARALMEPRFGQDFSRVRVHADDGAARAARSIDAHAFTVGRHIVFGEGRYTTSDERGRFTLAHELAHVVQQRGAPAPRVQASPAVGESSGEAEAEADAAAARVVSGQSVGGTLRARAPSALQRAVNAPILPFNQPDAQVCLVHLHRDEGNALHVAESIWTDYCANMVRIGGSPSRRCVDVTAGGRTCTADPNRVFSDAAINADVPFGGECGCPTAARPAMRAELLAFRPRLEAAIGRCRGGSGTDINGPLPVVAFHNNTPGGGLSINSFSPPTGSTAPTADQLAAQEGRTRLTAAAAMLSRIPFTGTIPTANPSALTGTGPDPHRLRDPDNFLLVTDISDYLHFSPTHNVVLQGTTPETVRPSFDDGSLAVRLRNQRYVNIEAEEKRFTNTSSPLYITNRQMAESVMTRLGIPRRPCPAPAPGGGGSGAGGATTGTTGTGTTTTGTTGTTTTGTGTTGTGTAGTGTTATAVRCNSVRTALTPCLTECRTFADLAQLDALKGCWRAQIDSLPLRDAVCWMTGRQQPPDAVRTETVRQRSCMLDDLRTTAAASGSGITVPAGARGTNYANWLESDYRPAVRLPGVSGSSQQRIWDRKYDFTYTTTTLRHPDQVFDRITQNARNVCGTLLGTETQWDPANDNHRVCWDATPIRPRTAPAMPTGARHLRPDEKQREILQASSAPGVSRHHWGTDFDLFSVNAARWTSGGATPNFSAAYDWLAGRPASGTRPAVTPHAGRYGFLQSFTAASAAAGTAYMEEQWHWSYYPVAQALLEFSRVPAVDTELNSQLNAFWGTAQRYNFIAPNWRDFVRNVNQTPSF